MATTVYTGTQILSYLANGRIDTLTNAARAIHRTQGTGFHATITGTDASFTNLTAGGTQPFDVSIDGAAYTNPTITTGTMTLFSGLSEGAHTVDCRLRAAYVGTGVYFTLASNSLSVTGAAPAVAVDANYGPSKIMMGQDKYMLATMTGQQGSGLNNGPLIGGTGILPTPPSAVSRALTCTGSRFVARADKIYVFTGSNAVWFTLEKDGVKVSSTLTSISGWTWVQIGSGLDDGSSHEWTVVCSSNAGVGQVVDMVMISGASASFSNTVPTTRRFIHCLGDSLTASVDGGGAGTTGGDGSLAWGYVLARALGKDCMVSAYPGHTTADLMYQVINDMTFARQTGNIPTHMAILIGRNDSNQATVTTNYTILLNNILSVPHFTGNIVAITVPQIGSYATNGALVNAGIRAAVAAVGSSRVTIAEAYDQSIGVGSDGTHYTIAGQAALATFLQGTGAFADASVSGTYPAPFIGC